MRTLLLRRRIMSAGGPGIKPVQIVRNGNFADGTDEWAPYSTSNGALSAADGILTYEVLRKLTNIYGNKIYNTNAIFYEGHVYYFVGDIYVPVACNVSFIYQSAAKEILAAVPGWNHYSARYKYTASVTKCYMGVNSMSAFSVGDEVLFKNVYVIDLTLTFGAGNEPTLAQCQQLFTEDYYPFYYNDPNNLWDGTYSSTGRYLLDNGSTSTSDNYNITNYIEVVGGSTIRIAPASGNTPAVVLYDASKGFISGEKYANSNVLEIVLPADCKYIRASVPVAKIDTFTLVYI